MTEVLNITEKEYRGLKMPSYSLLKRLDEDGPKSLLKSFKIEGEAIDFGSLVDAKMNPDMTKEEFDSKFYFESIEKPTAQLLELADYIVKLCEDQDCPIDFYIDNINDVLEISNDLKLFGGVKDEDKRIAKFNVDLFWNYLKAKADSRGKIVTTPETLLDANEAMNILNTHNNTKDIYNVSPNQQVFNQLQLVVNINDKPVKIMLDRVVVDHDTKMIYPYDLKCTDQRQKSFRFVFKKMKYYLQSSLYRNGLLMWCDENYPGYAVDDFKFIVYSRYEKYPFVWIVPDNWYSKGLYGFTDEVGQYHKGVYELLKDYYFYTENNIYSIEREFIINSDMNI